MTDEELMQQALEVLERCPALYKAPEAATALRERLAQPQMQPCAGRNCGSTNPNLHSAECFEDYDKATGIVQQEPVAYLCENAVGHKYFRWKKPSSTYKPIALYTTPPQRQPLTDEEIDVLVMDSDGLPKSHLEFARDIEAAHGIKENV